MNEETNDNSEITIHICGIQCEHQWDGPEFEEDGWVSVSCSKCGELAINVSMREGP